MPEPLPPQGAPPHPTDRSSGERQLFYAVLYPNRSLSRAGFIVVMAIFGTVSVVAGFFFTMQGAWPIAGFYGLDLVLLYLVFRLSYRSGRVREIIQITSREVRVERHMPGRPPLVWQFQPYWVRLVVEAEEDEDIRVLLSSHGQSVKIGAFLSPQERRDLAASLRPALHAASRG